MQTSGSSCREIAKVCLMNDPAHTLPSSPAKAGDPVFQRQQ